MKSTVAIIGVATAGVIGLTLGAVLSPGGTALADPVNANAVHAAPSYAMPWGPGGLSGPGGPDKPGPGWGRRPDFRMKLARDLAGLETLIGIRADQLDAWRDYTSALQAVLAPPGPDHGPGGSGNRGPGAADGSGGKADQGPRDPFAFQERLADDVTERAVAATKLKDAISVLRTKLTPEQLEILASAEPHEPPPGPWGHPPHAAGPGGLPGHDSPEALPRTDEQL